MNRNRKVQNKAKNRDGVELHLGPMKTEQVSTLDVSDENIEFLSPEDPEAQKILKLTSDEITYLLDDDGNYYFHTSDADEDIEEIQKEVIQIKSERIEANEGTAKMETSSVLEKVKLNLAKTQTQRKLKPKPSSSSAAAQSSTIVKTNASHTDTEDYANDDAIVEEDDDPNEPDEIYEFQENDEANKVKPDSTLIRKNAVRLKPMTNIDQTKDQNGELSCHLCDYKTTKKFTLSRHMKSHTNEKPFKCFVCDRGFKTKTSIMNHVNTHLGKKPYACKDCPSSFTTTGELVRHTRYKHTGEKPHKCTECDYASVELSKLRRHIRCHTGERPYQCPHCTYASPDTFKLKRHMRTHTGEKPYECDICQARFTQSNSLKTHRLIHSVSDKPVFQCQFCPTTCGRKTDLRMHVLKIHNSDKPITCKRCGKELPDRYAYKLHVKTHQGEKCYRCKLCPYAAVLMRHLETHMLIHTDEKPFVCEVCQQRFRQRQLLRRHLNLYHNKDYVPPVPRAKEHGCPFCKRSFAHKGNLMRHMEVHDPNSNALKQKIDLKLGRKTRMQDVMPGSSNADSMDGNEEEDEDEEAYDDPAYHEDYDEIDNENYELIDANDEEEGHNGVGGNYQEDNLDSGAVDAVDGVDGGDLIESYVDIKPSVANIPKRNMSQQNATHGYESGGLKTVNIKKESDGSEYISVAADDGQEYMILEVTQSDDEGGLDDVGVELAQNDNNDYTVMAPPVAANSVEYQPNRGKQLKHLVTINKIEHIPCQPIMPVKLEAAANPKATKIIEIKDVNQKVVRIIAIDE